VKARLLDISNGLAVINKWGQFTVSPRFGFNLARATKVIEPILSVYEAERIKLLNTYGEPPKEGQGNYVFEEGKLAEFNNALAELLRTDTDLPISPLPITMLDDEAAKGFAPTLSELIAISWLFEQEVKDESSNKREL